MAKICIDAGHGGKDPGAVSLGRKEKDDVLKLGLRVKILLEEQGVKVVLTRSTDQFITIAERTALANRENCDYFLSLHRDSFSDKSANGSNIYIYSKASKDTESKAVTIYEEILKASGFRRRGLVKGAANFNDYGVNKQTSMSASLVELGFITNAQDNLLFDAAFDDIAIAITKALCQVVGKEYKDKVNLEKTKSTSKPAPRSSKYTPTVKEWQLAAIADGFKFPKFGADGHWGKECEAVATKALLYKRILYTNKNLTRLVQKFLGISVDGKFGNDTRSAVIRYQKSHGLTPDGVVGISTYKKILNAK